MPLMPANTGQGSGPGFTESLLSRARRAARDGWLDEAAGLLSRLLTADPVNADALHELAKISTRRGDTEGALRHYRLLVKIRREDPEILTSCGLILEQIGDFEDALVCFQKAATVKPDDLETRFRLANLFYYTGRFAEAADAFGSIRGPGWSTEAAHGAALKWSGRQREALDVFDADLAGPDSNSHSFMNKADLLLCMGDLPGGFALYEHRWDHIAHDGRTKSGRPAWLGEPALAGKTLYVRWEQGFGDSVQFSRYIPMAARAGARVILEVRQPLLRLMKSLEGVSHLMTETDPVPEHDLYCPILSLPLAFGTTVATIPADVPYLHAEPGEVAAWNARLQGVAGKKIGLVFAGSARRGVGPHGMAADKRRSIPMAALAPLVSAPGCTFISLQTGEPAAQAAHPPPGMVLLDRAAELTDFADTAALIACLDLVISVDTAVAHVAGAMGKKVWLLNRFDTDWRWMLDRTDSPWYPTMRIFRQPVSRDWAAPITQVAEALRIFAAS